MIIYYQINFLLSFESIFNLIIKYLFNGCENMVKIEDIMEHKKTLIFVGGMATALIGKKILESQTTKDFCSRSMAKVIAMKTDAEASIQDIKDNAEDIQETEAVWQPSDGCHGSN